MKSSSTVVLRIILAISLSGCMPLPFVKRSKPKVELEGTGSLSLIEGSVVFSTNSTVCGFSSI